MNDRLKFLITGGAGFIGSAVVRRLIKCTNHYVLNLDKLTYAANLDAVSEVAESNRYQFVQADICDRAEMERVFESFQPDVVMHLAAESHVDRSISGPAEFIQTNIFGTYTLLEVSRSYFAGLSIEAKKRFRFHHVSTDEVYGDLEGKDELFTEDTPYAPSSPYSASKASSDHLVRAWYRTYNLPVIVTNCSNNYGPWQFPEKFIPVTILNALQGKPIPVYGDGRQVRDWLFVDDHVKALVLAATKGSIGETYNIGTNNELENLAVVYMILDYLNQTSALRSSPNDLYSLITFVEDRDGHDRRYAIDSSKITDCLGWNPSFHFSEGLVNTIDWYANQPRNTK